MSCSNCCNFRSGDNLAAFYFHDKGELFFGLFVMISSALLIWNSRLIFIVVMA